MIYCQRLVVVVAADTIDCKMKLFCDYKFIDVIRSAVAILLVTAFGSVLLFTPVHFSKASSEDGHISQVDILKKVAEDSDLVPAGSTGTDQPLSNFFGKVINPILGITGSVFLVLIIYAGVLWMMAAGNEERVGQAKKILSTSAVGVILIIGAYAITRFAINNALESTKSPSEQPVTSACVYNDTVFPNCESGNSCAVKTETECSQLNGRFLPGIEDCEDVCVFMQSPSL